MSEKLLVPDIGELEKVEVIEVWIKVGEQNNIQNQDITIKSEKERVEMT